MRKRIKRLRAPYQQEELGSVSAERLSAPSKARERCERNAKCVSLHLRKSWRLTPSLCAAFDAFFFFFLYALCWSIGCGTSSSAYQPRSSFFLPAFAMRSESRGLDLHVRLCSTLLFILPYTLPSSSSLHHRLALCGGT
jgi:hypothetical protein